MNPPGTPHEKPHFLVCEDGNEYVERFERFLGAQYAFMQSQCASELVAQLIAPPPPVAILLDLDFRRTDATALIDGEGRGLLNASNEERKHLTANQGIAILSCIRRLPNAVPALLFADITKAQQTFLEQRFAPLTIVPSHVSMRELQALLSSLTQRSTRS